MSRCLVFIFSLLFQSIFAQTSVDLKHAELYSGGQYTTQDIINVSHDPSGNRYNLIYSGSYTIMNSLDGDSLFFDGVTDTISAKRYHSYILTKISPKNKLLFTTRIDVFEHSVTNSFFVNTPFLKVTNNEGICILFTSMLSDSIHLINTNSQLERRIVPKFGAKALSFAWQLNTTGNTSFINEIHYQDAGVSNNSVGLFFPGYLLSNYLVADSGLRTLYLDKRLSSSSSQVLFVSENGNINSLSIDSDAFIRVDSSGNFQSLQYIKYSNGELNLKSSVLFLDKIGSSQIELLNVRCERPDTLLGSLFLIDSGEYTILVQRDTLQSIKWIYPLGKGVKHYYISNNPQKETLLLTLQVDRSEFSVVNQPNLSGYNNLVVYLAEIDLKTGQLVWSNFIGSSFVTRFYRWDFNKATGGYFMSGTMYGPQLNIGSFTYQNIDGKSNNFILYMDSMHIVRGSNSLSDIYNLTINSPGYSTYNIWMLFDSTIIGNHFLSEVVSPRGSVSLFGTFCDSLFLGCSVAMSKGFKSQYDYQGFEVEYIPNDVLIDTIICGPSFSPSGRFFWNKSAVYSDTLSFGNGCSRSVQYNVIVSQYSKEQIVQSNPITCDLTEAVICGPSKAKSYHWYPRDYLSSDTIACPIISFLPNSTWYILKVIDSNSCESVDSIWVDANYVKDSLQEIPNVITPNYDGLNDCLDSHIWGAWNHVTLRVFNRWGGLVYEKIGREFCWNGKSEDGTSLNDGVYYLMVVGELGCISNYVYQGTLTIIRD